MMPQCNIKPIQPSSMSARSGTTLAATPHGAILASGKNPQQVEIVDLEFLAHRSTRLRSWPPRHPADSGTSILDPAMARYDALDGLPSLDARTRR